MFSLIENVNQAATQTSVAACLLMTNIVRVHVSLYEKPVICRSLCTAATFLSGSVLDWQRDEFLVGRQDRPLRLRLLPLHVPVELPSLGPGAKLLHGDLLKVEPLLEVRAERFKVCNEGRSNETPRTCTNKRMMVGSVAPWTSCWSRVARLSFYFLGFIKTTTTTNPMLKCIMYLGCSMFIHDWFIVAEIFWRINQINWNEFTFSLSWQERAIHQ